MGKLREYVEINIACSNLLFYLIINKTRLNHLTIHVRVFILHAAQPKSAFQIIFYFSFSFCHLFGILCTIMFSSKPICICIANIHFHFGFMFLPSLLIGFGSFPNVQCVPSNNYIPEEIFMNFFTDFDGLSAHHQNDIEISFHVKDA